MAFMKTEQYESTPNILESEVGLVLKTYTAEQTNAETVGTKRSSKQVLYIRQMQPVQKESYLKRLI